MLHPSLLAGLIPASRMSARLSWSVWLHSGHSVIVLLVQLSISLGVVERTAASDGGAQVFHQAMKKSELLA